jgi:ketosteroid isomerase-like protein
MAATTEVQSRTVMEVEQRFWNAMKEKDSASAGRLTDDRCIIVGAQGVSAITPEVMSKLTSEGKWELEQYAFDEKHRQVHFVSDDVAIVAYTVRERVTVDGETVPIEANDSSVWVRRGGQWRCALHTESLAGDPFGRDRRSDATSARSA